MQDKTLAWYSYDSLYLCSFVFPGAPGWVIFVVVLSVVSV